MYITPPSTNSVWTTSKPKKKSGKQPKITPSNINIHQIHPPTTKHVPKSIPPAFQPSMPCRVRNNSWPLRSLQKHRSSPNPRPRCQSPQVIPRIPVMISVVLQKKDNQFWWCGQKQQNLRIQELHCCITHTTGTHKWRLCSDNFLFNWMIFRFYLDFQVFSHPWLV